MYKLNFIKYLDMSFILLIFVPSSTECKSVSPLGGLKVYQSRSWVVVLNKDEVSPILLKIDIL